METGNAIGKELAYLDAGASIADLVVFSDSGEIAAERAIARREGFTAALEIARDRTAQPAARVGAARLLLDYSGELGSARSAAVKADLASMSAAELRQVIAQCDAEIASKATDITPDPLANVTESFDMFEQSAPK